MSIASLRVAIESTINAHSGENGSDTPDFILADYMMGCLAAFDAAIRSREEWYGRPNNPSGDVPPVPPENAPLTIDPHKDEKR